MRAPIFFWVLVLSVLCLGTASAANIKMVNDVGCTGECTVTQSYNGESVQVTSSGSTRMVTTAENGSAQMAIDSQGQGEVRTNLKENSSLSVSIDNNSSNSWENFSDSHWNESEMFDIDDNAVDDSGLINDSFVEDALGNDSGNILENDSSGILGNESNITDLGNNTVEINASADYKQETTENDGLIQRIYQFFQGFSAMIKFG